jgi:hypothetical protein
LPAAFQADVDPVTFKVTPPYEPGYVIRWVANLTEEKSLCVFNEISGVAILVPIVLWRTESGKDMSQPHGPPRLVTGVALPFSLLVPSSGERENTEEHDRIPCLRVQIWTWDLSNTKHDWYSVDTV